MKNLLILIFFLVLLSPFLTSCQKNFDIDIERISNLKNHNVKNVESLVLNNKKNLNIFLGNADEIIVNEIKIEHPGEYDFSNKILTYSGREKRCGKSTKGFSSFIKIGQKWFFGQGKITIKNLTIRRSAPDGIEIRQTANVKFVNLKILHSCDEGIQVRSHAKIELLDSKIISQYNKAIQFGDNNNAIISNSTIISEQAFSLTRENLNIKVSESTIRKHPSARFGRLITGDNCKNINIDLVNTKTIGLGEFVGTKNCTNIVINKKKYR
tara:strand:- start:91 stop:894 length:804 start_codon:yes stop_codon:yes gene_type:complete